MTRMVVSAGGLVLGLMLAAAGGCATIDVPPIPDVNIGGAPPPPATVVPANPNSPSDVQRENQELKARIAWLEDRIRRADSTAKGQDREITDLHAELEKLARERDRYRREAGQ